MSGPALVVTDLDRTLIYSAQALALGGGVAPEAVDPVEYVDGAPISFLTHDARDRYRELAEVALVVPATTRIERQYARVRLPRPPPYAVIANGGVLHVDGAPDAEWHEHVRTRLRTVAPLAEVWAHAQALCDPGWTRTLRDADGLFCYAVVDLAALPGGVVEQTSAWAAARGWRTSLQGRKLYWVPQPLTKSAAVAEIARRTGARLTLAAGDSLLDADLLLAADDGIHPRHGELYEQGWSAPHVRCTDAAGPAAAAELLRWALAHVTTPTDPGRVAP